jgi:hypothetical protein
MGRTNNRECLTNLIVLGSDEFGGRHVNKFHIAF